MDVNGVYGVFEKKDHVSQSPVDILANEELLL